MGPACPTEIRRGKTAAGSTSAVLCQAVRADTRRIFAFTLILAGGSGACLADPPAGASRIAAVRPPGVTIQQLMSGQVDPAADALWESVATIVSAAAIKERRPHTTAEWQAVRRQALSLIDATRLLGMPGRRVADRATAPKPGELAQPEIQRRIDANTQAFVGFASALQVAGQQALAAIDARDPQRLMDAGGVINSACEACHLTYWYPMPNAPAAAAKP